MSEAHPPFGEFEPAQPETSDDGWIRDAIHAGSVELLMAVAAKIDAAKNASALLAGRPVSGIFHTVRARSENEVGIPCVRINLIPPSKGRATAGSTDGQIFGIRSVAVDVPTAFAKPDTMPELIFIRGSLESGKQENYVMTAHRIVNLDALTEGLEIATSPMGRIVLRHASISSEDLTYDEPLDTEDIATHEELSTRLGTVARYAKAIESYDIGQQSRPGSPAA